jgi:hypothetical protein
MFDGGFSFFDYPPSLELFLVVEKSAGNKTDSRQNSQKYDVNGQQNTRSERVFAVRWIEAALTNADTVTFTDSVSVAIVFALRSDRDAFLIYAHSIVPAFGAIRHQTRIHHIQAHVDDGRRTNHYFFCVTNETPNTITNDLLVDPKSQDLRIRICI